MVEGPGHGGGTANSQHVGRLRFLGVRTKRANGDLQSQYEIPTLVISRLTIYVGDWS